MEDPKLRSFEPADLSDADLRSFGLTDEEIADWREFYSDPANSPWNDPETLLLARKLQLIFQEYLP